MLFSILAVILFRNLVKSYLSYLENRQFNSLVQDVSIPILNKPIISDEVKGIVSIFIWLNLCTSSVDVLKGLAGFPEIPDLVEYTDSLIFSRKSSKFGQRVFGYILPDKTGNYSFAIGNYFHGGSELWLSSCFDPRNVRLIAYTNAQSQDSHSTSSFSINSISTQLFLHLSEAYYFEVFITVNLKIDEFSILWKPPDFLEYEVIGGDNIARFDGIGHQEFLLQLPCYETSIPLRGIEDARNEIPFLKKLNHSYYLKAFPFCRYSPSYLKKQTFARYAGYQHVIDIKVFVLNSSHSGNLIDQGIPTVWTHEAFNIVNLFLLTIHELVGNIFETFEILNIEQTHDFLKGDRYLIEGKVKLFEYPNNQFLLSQYVYKFKTADLLCIPSVLPVYTAFVHFVIIVKDQSRWVRYLIKNIESIYQITRDNRFGLTIVDFESIDMNISEYMLSTLTIPHYNFISLSGEFNKVWGQNTAIQRVNASDDIIFTCDLHLFIPVNIIELIRKHTIEGVSAFAPILRRLECGITLANEEGIWEIYGFGLFSMFKSDWKIVGGMNNKEFGLEWGGEDSELVDRVLGKGYEINRLRVPRLVHFYHSREGNWYKNYFKKETVLLLELPDKVEALVENVFNFKNLFDYLKTFW